MIIEIDATTIGVGCAVLTGLCTAAFYIGDSRWLKRRDWHERSSEISTILGTIQQQQASHAEKLLSGEQTMSRLEGMMVEQSRNISDAASTIARVEGILQGRGV